VVVDVCFAADIFGTLHPVGSLSKCILPRQHWRDDFEYVHVSLVSKELVVLIRVQDLPVEVVHRFTVEFERQACLALQL
jgi:hypothetical protein